MIIQTIKRYPIFLGVLLFILTSCSPKSLEDFREEAQGITRTLMKELQVIFNREELESSQVRLQKLFNSLVEVMIAAREFQEKNMEQEDLELTSEDHELSEKLRIELNRIFHIDGGREIIEKCQEHALHQLDVFEKRLARKKKV